MRPRGVGEYSVFKELAGTRGDACRPSSHAGGRLRFFWVTAQMWPVLDSEGRGRGGAKEEIPAADMTARRWKGAGVAGE